MQLIRASTVGMLFCLSIGCTSVTDISHESPYQEMIGQCYVLQQDMLIQETCWVVGDLVLSIDGTGFCFDGNMGEVPKGTEVTISAIKERVEWSIGRCPQLILEIPDIEIPGREVSPPVCSRVNEFSWGKEFLWSRGSEIYLKEEYVKPCE
ncbi:hypothetical protein [Aliidiomarina celeris]|uniref:hypothetical protein n=1 Tax=Aliidiomarina celeris TaxID=2249428 RepID=UPI000DEA753F|nr:hypothetical protein [Aliidiomarina celeris]